ncbi:MAG: NAD-dependent epimerase/dehydratase family protein [Candidatus Eremiobacteraeota bacterium]|nr:NAD-dependent epimerase/dehydratase family protein [Candidatus Eremiobacteraeota bacterium]
MRKKRALVTGGAGLIGSHIVDALIADDWYVRAFDNLEPQTHKAGKPRWVHPKADFMFGDMRDAGALRRALDNVDVVFHQAAYGGYMPDIAKYVHVNSYGTALMLETIREARLPVRKVIVASSQAVYVEGATNCERHGNFFPSVRVAADLARGNYAVFCPDCGRATSPVPTPETMPLGGETVYAITKVDQERLVLTWGKQTGIPTVALRYSCTFGPRQSIFNPYTGVIAIFCTRLLNGLPPILYEDGEQTRDFSFVQDVARANMLVAQTDRLDGLPVNVGSGEATTIREIAKAVGEALDTPIEPVARGEFRPGEMRHLISDTSRIASIGYKPQTTLRAGIVAYLDWIRSQGDVREYFAEAEDGLRARGIVQSSMVETS